MWWLKCFEWRHTAGLIYTLPLILMWLKILFFKPEFGAKKKHRREFDTCGRALEFVVWRCICYYLHTLKAHMSYECTPVTTVYYIHILAHTVIVIYVSVPWGGFLTFSRVVAWNEYYFTSHVMYIPLGHKKLPHETIAFRVITIFEWVCNKIFPEKW